MARHVWDWDRIRYVVALLVGLFAATLAGAVLADVPAVVPPVADDPTVLLAGLQQALMGGKWGLALGLALMALVAVVGKTASVWRDIEQVKPWLPYISLVTAVAVAVGGALVTGGGAVSVAVAVLGALNVWLVAVGGWETLGKGIRAVLAKMTKNPQPRAQADAKAVISAAVREGSLDLSKLRGLGIRMYDPGDSQR